MQCIGEECSGDCKRRGRNEDGYKWKCRDCGIEFRVKTKPRPELMTGPPCAVCGGATANNNRTGVCTLNPSCRREWYALHGGPPGPMPGRENIRKGRYPADRLWELYEDYDEDGKLIVDDIAVQLAVDGVRKVRLTPTEQSIAARKMIRRGYGTAEVIDHLGVSINTLPKILDDIGYEIISDPAMAGAQNKRTIIVRKDRVRRECPIG